MLKLGKQWAELALALAGILLYSQNIWLTSKALFHPLKKTYYTKQLSNANLSTQAHTSTLGIEAGEAQ